MSSSVRISLNREPFVQLVDCNKNKFEADQLRETGLIFPTKRKKVIPAGKSSEQLQVPAQPRESEVPVVSRFQTTKVILNGKIAGSLLAKNHLSNQGRVCWLLKRLAIQKNVSRWLFPSYYSDKKLIYFLKAWLNKQRSSYGKENRYRKVLPKIVKHSPLLDGNKFAQITAEQLINWGKAFAEKKNTLV